MDEEVHGFVWHALPPLNTFERSDDAFVPNGSDPSAHESLAQAEKKDIINQPSWTNSQQHGFVTSQLPPLSSQINSEYEFVPNGSDPSAFKGSASLAQAGNKDILDENTGANEKVHGFVTANLPPLSMQFNSEKPFLPNGSDPSAHPSSFAQQQYSNLDSLQENWHAFESE